MSEPLRIALVAEGETDKVVVGAAIAALVGDRSYVLRLLQPEDSLALGPVEPFTGLKSGGWGGVYHWCHGVVQRSGQLREDALFMAYDILILHLDADVAGKKYSDCSIIDPVNDLPCEQPCPPPAGTTDKLRQVLLRWCGETAVPPQTVLCTPSKSTEAWVVAALFPQDAEMQRKGWECHPNPESRLGVQPLAARIRKSKADYQSKQQDITAAWGRLRIDLSEAGRFSTDFVNAVPASP
jgi:hypothetical protein